MSSCEADLEHHQARSTTRQSSIRRITLPNPYLDNGYLLLLRLGLQRQLLGHMGTSPTAIQTHRTKSVNVPHGTHGTDIRLATGKVRRNIVVVFAAVAKGTFLPVCNSTALALMEMDKIAYKNITFASLFQTHVYSVALRLVGLPLSRFRSDYTINPDNLSFTRKRTLISLHGQHISIGSIDA